MYTLYVCYTFKTSFQWTDNLTDGQNQLLNPVVCMCVQQVNKGSTIDRVFVMYIHCMYVCMYGVTNHRWMTIDVWPAFLHPIR